MSKPYINLRVVIADDHEMVREGLQIMIGKMNGIEIVGEARNGEELVQVTRKLKPDVVMADVRMPKCSGVEATRIIKTEFPHIGVIALSSFDEEALIMDMLNAGAKGYLLKNACAREIIAAVQAAYRDEAYYCKDVNLKLAKMVAKGGQFVEYQKVKGQFTQREIEIIKMICEGLSSKQIADILNLKTRTIERYRDLIMEKMEVKNAAALVIFAVKNRLFDPSAPKK